MTWLWINIISPVFDALGGAWQWLTSGTTPAAVTVAVVLLTVVVVAIVSRRR